jgi:hypothetical protein
MAKKTQTTLRGTKLIKKAIEAGKDELLSDPDPVPASLLKKLTLPNGEGISPAMKELLKVDNSWLNLDFDDEEGDVEASSLDELLEDHFGEGAAAEFGEACELLDGDCIPLGGEGDTLRVLYVGEPDESGEYPVLIAKKDPRPWIGGFIPFDVWVAQEMGAVEVPETPGTVAAAYEAAAQALADANGDGRLGFEPAAREREEDEAGEEEEDEDEEEESDEAPESEDDVWSDEEELDDETGEVEGEGKEEEEDVEEEEEEEDVEEEEEEDEAEEEDEEEEEEEDEEEED